MAIALGFAALSGCQPPAAAEPATDTHAPLPAASSEHAPRVASAQVSAPKSNAARYSWDDLEALEKQQAWTELGEHLEDIPPAERSSDWHKLVEQACSAIVADPGVDDPILAAELASELARRYPSLKSSDRFRAAAGEVAIRAIGACTVDDARWKRCPPVAAMLAATVRSPKQTEKAAQVAAGNGHRELAMALYRASSDAASVCNSDQALSLAMDGRGRPADSTFHKDAEAVLAQCAKLRSNKK